MKYLEFQTQKELIMSSVANWVRITKRYKCLLLYINIKAMPASAKYFNSQIVLEIFTMLWGKFVSLIVNFSVFINKEDC